MPSLKNRTLRIDPDNAGFIYQYKKCTTKFFIKRCVMMVDRYDLNDPKVRIKLKTMGFKLKVTK